MTRNDIRTFTRHGTSKCDAAASGFHLNTGTGTAEPSATSKIFRSRDETARTGVRIALLRMRAREPVRVLTSGRHRERDAYQRVDRAVHEIRSHPNTGTGTAEPSAHFKIFGPLSQHPPPGDWPRVRAGHALRLSIAMRGNCAVPCVQTL
ncbi:hypothetical protein GCM10022214_78090 [Actinomadura miaoliensis]|uniref:Uncharacterized protein n=1 Tax=Actinomadura miaoliensis TaxID=430685 RepID=A0ABP7WZS1_9ACTN